MKINTTIGSVNIQLDTSRLEKNIAEAQKKLNEQVVADCTPLIPFQQGGLRGSVIYPEGIYGGEVEWNTPFAHYQYMGELYLTSYGSSFAQRGEKKYPAGVPLNYHTPGTGAQWFEVAKERNLSSWLNLARETAGKD